jgi:hypothetical protein
MDIREDFIAINMEMQAIIQLRETLRLSLGSRAACIYRQHLTVRFEVSTAVTMKNGVFWDVMP